MPDISPSQTPAPVLPKILPSALLKRFRDGMLAPPGAQNDPEVLMRAAELDRALGDLSAAAEEFRRIQELQPENHKAKVLADLMAGTGAGPLPDIDGIAPFVLVTDLAPEQGLQQMRAALEARRSSFTAAGVLRNGKSLVNTDVRSAFSVRGDEDFNKMTRVFFRKAIDELHILERLGLDPISETYEEVKAIAYGAGGKFIPHRDNRNHSQEDNGRRLTVVWFVHEEPKGFSGGDLLLYDEPPQGKGFTRIIPKRNAAVFFPSHYLHEVTCVESTVEDVLRSRVVLNGWFHRAK